LTTIFLKVVQKLEKDLAHTVVANCSLWIPAQCINFALIPAQYQVLFANLVGLGWNTYLSMMTFSGTGSDSKESREAKEEGVEKKN
jgi:protein Mpv17